MLLMPNSVLHPPAETRLNAEDLNEAFCERGRADAAPRRGDKVIG